MTEAIRQCDYSTQCNRQRRNSVQVGLKRYLLSSAVVDGYVSVSWAQGWNCCAAGQTCSSSNNANPAYYPKLALVDIDSSGAYHTIQTVNVCETSGRPNSSCWAPQWFDKIPNAVTITKDDHIGIEVVQQAVNCPGGSPWPECLNSSGQSIGTCGGGEMFINAVLKGTP